MRKFFLLTGILTAFAICANGQQATSITNDSIRATELLLKTYADSMINGRSELNRQAALAMFNPTLMDLLLHPQTFHYPFDSLKSVSKLTSPDGNVKIYTWQYKSTSDGSFTYFGLVQKKKLKSSEIKLYGLKEKKYTQSVADTALLQADGWYGALYYDIIEKKINKNTYYFLLGWQGNDMYTNRKLIDVMWFDTWNTLFMGAPVFRNENNQLKSRVIFEFTAQAVMLLRYNKKKKMIVFDHLSPDSPAAKGQYRFYGPDFTYDGYYFRKGYWNYKSNLDLRNASDKK